MKFLGILVILGGGAVIYWVFTHFAFLDIFSAVFIVASLVGLGFLAVNVLGRRADG